MVYIYPPMVTRNLARTLRNPQEKLFDLRDHNRKIHLSTENVEQSHLQDETESPEHSVIRKVIDQVSSAETPKNNEPDSHGAAIWSLPVAKKTDLFEFFAKCSFTANIE
jgi:hypothetical protein